MSNNDFVTHDFGMPTAMKLLPIRYFSGIEETVSSAADRKESAPMNGFDSSPVLWLFIAAQILGVTSAWLARLSEGSAYQPFSQLAFFAMLPLMGMATIVALGVGPGWWLACSATLAFMVLTVTCDFRDSREAATW